MATILQSTSTLSIQLSRGQTLSRAEQAHHRASSITSASSSSRAATSAISSTETPRPAVIVTRSRRHRPPSTSSAELCAPPPPRYSQLSGALPSPPVTTTSTGQYHHIASDAGIVNAAVAAAVRAQSTVVTDESEVPPLYGNVFPQRTRAERELDRRAERRHSRRLSGSSNHLSANLAEETPGSRTTRARSRDRSHRTTPPIEPRMHDYHLTNAKGANSPWATLRVFSQTSVPKPAGTDPSASTSTAGADSPQVIPRYTSNEAVTGSLDLNLEAPMNINSIQLSLRGRIITSSWEGGSQTFIDTPILSWTRNGGDPRPKSIMAHLEGAEGRSSKKYEGKFIGKYSWPFSFPFPSEMEQSGTGSSTSSVSPSATPSSSTSQRSDDPNGTGPSSSASTRVTLPQTFSEREAKASVRYELVLRMTHGMLRSDSKLVVQVVYVPAVTPSPASALRQLAYAERMCVPGPEIDPVGWLQMAPVAVKGKFHDKSAKLICNLSIANPQSYTRGTAIPLNMSIESSYIQALDALALPKALSVRLMRRIAYFEDGGAGANREPTVSVAQGRRKVVVVSSLAPDAHNPMRRLVEETTEMEKAVWWVNMDVAEQEPHKRRLEGEIHLDRDMPASCTFPHFMISYTVELFPFESSAWACSKSSTPSVVTRSAEAVVPKPLISQPVVIATLHGEGHAAVPYTKAISRSSKKKPAKKHATSSASVVPLVMSGFL